MPELPELEVLKENLASKILGKKIEKVKIFKPYLLKTLARPEKDLIADKFTQIHRRGKYLIFSTTSGFKVVIHLMLSGRIEYSLRKRKYGKAVSAIFSFQGGVDMCILEFGPQKRAALYVVRDLKEIPNFRNLGIEPLDSTFTHAVLHQLLHKENRRLKSFLVSQRSIMGIGNAYADEILWEAGLSPFKSAMTLRVQETESLHRAIQTVLRWAIGEIKKRVGEELPIKEPREFLRIHNKKGGKCPRCEQIIQWVSYRDRNTYYCPDCQTQGRILKDRRYSRFLKLIML
jgi:formamidopyrimidine-DNA glycosylase